MGESVERTTGAPPDRARAAVHRSGKFFFFIDQQTRFVLTQMYSQTVCLAFGGTLNMCHPVSFCPPVTSGSYFKLSGSGPYSVAQTLPAVRRKPSVWARLTLARLLGCRQVPEHMLQHHPHPLAPLQEFRVRTLLVGQQLILLLHGRQQIPERPTYVRDVRFSAV